MEKSHKISIVIILLVIFVTCICIYSTRVNTRIKAGNELKVIPYQGFAHSLANRYWKVSGEGTTVIIGAIPNKCYYWCIRTEKGIVSSADYTTCNTRDYIAVIVTESKYNLLKQHVAGEWRKNRTLGSSKLYISHIAGGNIIINTVMREAEDPNPVFTARQYFAGKNVSHTLLPKTISKSPKETDPGWKFPEAEREYFLSQLASDNSDITLASCAVELYQDELLVIVALNHAATGRATYSDVTISREEAIHTTVTGDSKKKIFNTLSARIIEWSIPGSYSILEKVYVEPRSRTGPCYYSLLPCKIYVYKNGSKIRTFLSDLSTH